MSAPDVILNFSYSTSRFENFLVVFPQLSRSRQLVEHYWAVAYLDCEHFLKNNKIVRLPRCPLLSSGGILSNFGVFAAESLIFLSKKN